MSATAKPVASPSGTIPAASTFDQIKGGALNTVNWMGKQIQWLGSTIKQYAIKIFEWAKPFFQNIGKMLAETYDKVREFVIANQTASIAVGITVLLTTLAILTMIYWPSDSKSESPAPATTTA